MDNWYLMMDYIHCKFCRTQYYTEKRDKSKNYFSEILDRLINNRNNYNIHNRPKKNVYVKNRRDTDCIFKLAHKIGNRTGQAFKSQKNGKN